MNAYLHHKTYYYPFEGDVGRRDGDRTVMGWSMDDLMASQERSLVAIQDMANGMLPGFVYTHHTGYWLFKISKEIHRRQMLALEGNDG